MSDDHWQKFSGFGEPTMTLHVREASGIAANLQLCWTISRLDASMWKRPIAVSIRPEIRSLATDEQKAIAAAEMWSVEFDLTREDARLLSDWLHSLLRLPDLRQEVTEDHPHEHVPGGASQP